MEDPTIVVREARSCMMKAQRARTQQEAFEYTQRAMEMFASVDKWVSESGDMPDQWKVKQA